MTEIDLSTTKFNVIPLTAHLRTRLILCIVIFVKVHCGQYSILYKCLCFRN